MLFGEVTALAEAKIFLGIEPKHFREEILDFGEDRLGRTVVQHDNLGIHALARIAHRLEACRNKVARIIGDYDDGA